MIDNDARFTRNLKCSDRGFSLDGLQFADCAGCVSQQDHGQHEARSLSSDFEFWHSTAKDGWCRNDPNGAGDVQTIYSFYRYLEPLNCHFWLFSMCVKSTSLRCRASTTLVRQG